MHDRTGGPEVDALGSAVAWALDALPGSSRTLLEVASLLPDGLALGRVRPARRVDVGRGPGGDEPAPPEPSAGHVGAGRRGRALPAARAGPRDRRGDDPRRRAAGPHRGRGRPAPGHRRRGGRAREPGRPPHDGCRRGRARQRAPLGRPARRRRGGPRPGGGHGGADGGDRPGRRSRGLDRRAPGSGRRAGSAAVGAGRARAGGRAGLLLGYDGHPSGPRGGGGHRTRVRGVEGVARPTRSAGARPHVGRRRGCRRRHARRPRAAGGRPQRARPVGGRAAGAGPIDVHDPARRVRGGARPAADGDEPLPRAGRRLVGAVLAVPPLVHRPDQRRRRAVGGRAPPRGRCASRARPGRRRPSSARSWRSTSAAWATSAPSSR